MFQEVQLFTASESETKLTGVVDIRTQHSTFSHTFDVISANHKSVNKRLRLVEQRDVVSPAER